MATQLVWFKKDLRITDHWPLAQAARHGPVLPLFVYEEELIAAPDWAPRHHEFLNESLLELKKSLSQLGGSLVLLRGRLPECFDVLHEKHPFETIWSHEETGNGLSYARDQRVALWAEARGIAWKEYPQNGVVRRLRTRDGWSTIWESRMREPIITLRRDLTFAAGVVSQGIQNVEMFGREPEQLQEKQPGGSLAGRDLLDSFLNARGVAYAQSISSPVSSHAHGSRLSVHLTFGTLSLREVVQALRDRVDKLRDSHPPEIRAWRASLKAFGERLRWRCHFIQKLEDEPDIEYHNFSRACDGLRERAWNEDNFTAWREGRTGYPMVDACMRCLISTGWINFRMRAMLMSFAAYHLWLHWREPALHLARLFTDYEPGIHYSQCQMQSGTTGINTIRIYSPSKQQMDHDPQGIFVRRWIPELAEVPTEFLAAPHSMSAMERTLFGCDQEAKYPTPIVNHREAYQAAKQKMFRLRRTSESLKEADRVQRKHGSRRSPASRSWR